MTRATRASAFPHWADVLRLRPEIIDAQGRLGELQMSLYNAVYRTVLVRYDDPAYYSEITEPTPGLRNFMATIAARLGGGGPEALFHLDQGMGGGKSHALVGLYHLAQNSAAFLATPLGREVRAAAEAKLRGAPLDLSHARAVVLAADHFSPGSANSDFGPAQTLHERFLWSLFGGDEAAYREALAQGPNKAALKRALERVACPVLVLLDELMEYALELSGKDHLATMPTEQAFLNSLMDAVDEVDRVAFVVVMIRSGAAEDGYPEVAQAFRAYLQARLERNGKTVAVSDAQDFARIIQRRLFVAPRGAQPNTTEAVETEAARAAIAAIGRGMQAHAQGPWQTQVFDKLGPRRSLAGFDDRLGGTYPFHPDLMGLVRDDWAKLTGFQQVRSTVRVFALAAHHWAAERAAGRWAPDLIGVGDLPLTVVLDEVLSSGILQGNDRAIQGFRQVAGTDVTSHDGRHGGAVAIDAAVRARLDGGAWPEPGPAVRMATALFYYSLATREHTKNGATKAELLATVFSPRVPIEYAAAEEVFNAVKSDETGLGALEVVQASARGIARYRLATTHTIRMLFRRERAVVAGDPARDAFLWERTRDLAQKSKGPFGGVIPVDMPDQPGTPLDVVFERVDAARQNRLVVLDARRWTLLNGRDGPTRDEVEKLLGIGPQHVAVDHAASCVVACVNTQRRDAARHRAADVLAYQRVVRLSEDPDQRNAAAAEATKAEAELDKAVRRAYQHVAYLTGGERSAVAWARFDEDTTSALNGADVWELLRTRGRAANPGDLTGEYLATLLASRPRDISLAEVVELFTRDANFPLVRDDQEIRRAIFETLQPGGAYELVGDDGSRLVATTPADLAINSRSVHLRRRRVAADAAAGSPRAGNGGQPEAPGHPGFGGGATPGGTRPADPDAGGHRDDASEADAEQRTFKRYALRITNRSIKQDAARRAIWHLLTELADSVDPSQSEVELISVDVTLVAPADTLESLAQRATAADAPLTAEDEPF